MNIPLFRCINRVCALSSIQNRAMMTNFVPPYSGKFANRPTGKSVRKMEHRSVLQKTRESTHIFDDRNILDLCVCRLRLHSLFDPIYSSS